MSAFQKWQPSSETLACKPNTRKFDDDGLRTPAGYGRIEAYWSEDKRRIVVCGDPPDDERLPEEQQHNCDWMGCGTFSHVLCRIDVPRGLFGWLTVNDGGAA